MVGLGQQEDAQQQSVTTDSKQQPAAAGKAGKQDRYVYLSNLPVEAFEGTIRHVFEKEGIQVVSFDCRCKACNEAGRSSREVATSCLMYRPAGSWARVHV